MNPKIKVGILTAFIAGAALTFILLPRESSLRREQAERLQNQQVELVTLRERNAHAEREIASLREQLSTNAQPARENGPRMTKEDEFRAADSQRNRSAPERKIEELRNVGKATPSLSLESIIWAKESVDISVLSELITLDPEVRVKAQKLFDEFSEADRHKYAISTPEQLLAFGWTGLGTQFSALQQAAEIERDANTVSIYAVVRTEGTNAGDRRFDFRRTDDGWRWLMPAGMVDGLRGELDRLRSQKSGRK